jgi:hypothetical protein
MRWHRREARRVGKAKRAHHLHPSEWWGGGHGASAPLPTLRLSLTTSEAQQSRLDLTNSCYDFFAYAPV